MIFFYVSEKNQSWLPFYQVGLVLVAVGFGVQNSFLIMSYTMRNRSSSYWWFGVRDSNHDTVLNLLNVHPSVRHIILHETIGRLDNKPFIEGLVEFHSTKSHDDVMRLIPCSFARSNSSCDWSYFRRGSFYEVDCLQETTWRTVRSIIITNFKRMLRGMLWIISKLISYTEG